MAAVKAVLATYDGPTGTRRPYLNPIANVKYKEELEKLWADGKWITGTKEHTYLWSIYHRTTAPEGRQDGLSLLDKSLTRDNLLRLSGKLRETGPGSAPSIIDRYKLIKKEVLQGPHLSWCKICPSGKPSSGSNKEELIEKTKKDWLASCEAQGKSAQAYIWTAFKTFGAISSDPDDNFCTEANEPKVEGGDGRKHHRAGDTPREESFHVKRLKGESARRPGAAGQGYSNMPLPVLKESFEYFRKANKERDYRQRLKFAQSMRQQRIAELKDLIQLSVELGDAEGADKARRELRDFIEAPFELPLQPGSPPRSKVMTASHDRCEETEASSPTQM